MKFVKVNTLTLTDPSYPDILRNISQPPEQLYWAGSAPKDWISQPRVAIVGSRKISSYGHSVTQKISNELARRGVVIISGLALGVDSVAHQTALDEGGCTVAVLPTPLDDIYPPSHLNLARQILHSGGTLISEFPPGVEIFRTNFITRNRIVSGLAEILLITEAAVNSGTLHTARFALDQGKTVMAIPGNINQSGSEGCNNLIKSGAVPVTDVNDVLFALGLPVERTTSSLKLNMLSGNQKKLYELIASGLADQEELAMASRLDAAQLGTTLTSLELTGLVRPEGAGRWVIS